MIVLYRICPYSNGKSPVFTHDKLGLVSFCLRSFIKAFKKVQPKIIFILDSCPAEYIDLIEKIVPFAKELLSQEGIGNTGSYLRQLEVASRLAENTPILIQEDDYFYLPDSGEKVLAGIEAFDFITPYDHPEHYREPWCHDLQSIALAGGHHWRTFVSTCLTFGTRAGKIKANLPLMRSFGIADHPMWIKLLSSTGLKLYGPVPSLATHLVSGLLALNINWEKEWSKYR